MYDNVKELPESVALKACEWVAKLDRGNLSNTECRQLQMWLKQDPSHSSALMQQIDQWSDMDVLSELQHLGLEVEGVSLRDRVMSFWGMGNVGFYRFSALLVIVSVLMFGVVVPNAVTPSEWSLLSGFTDDSQSVNLGIATTTGEQKKEALPDGSVIHVNTTSSANIHFSEKERSVHVEKGELFFDVAHDEERPFVVYAGDTSVTAVGTAFAVITEDDSVKVLVTEGAVEFTSGGVRSIIAANTPAAKQIYGDALGNIGLYQNAQISIDTKPADIVTRQLLWHEGMLEFRGESLEYVIEELSRYTDTEIRIVDDGIRDIRLGGYFKIGDLDGFASTLKLGFDIETEHVSDDLIHLSRIEK